MSLNNSLYNAIIRSYEEKQRAARLELEARTDEIYEKIPAYAELAKQVSAVSIAQSRKMLNGDTSAIQELKQQLHQLSTQKTKLLLQHGYPADYLEPHYSCKLCKDTGYYENRKCTCFRRAEIDLLYDKKKKKNALQVENFSNLSYDYYVGEDLEKFKKAVAECRNFIKTFDTDYHNLFFYGTVGTGKSFLSSCIAKELIENGKLVLYFSSTQLFDTLSKSTFDRDSAEAASGIYEDIYECDLLIIDDLGTELTNAFVTSQLFSCINNRHLRRKSTIISTNLSMAEIRDRYSERILSRITSNYEVFKLTGRDIRYLKKVESNRK